MESEETIEFVSYWRVKEISELGFLSVPIDQESLLSAQ